MRRFRYREGHGITGVKADVVGQELDRIAAENDGEVEAKTVVDEARPDDAPLHPAFEWRDPVAAEMWREEQARRVIRSVEVIKPDGETHRAYFKVQPVGVVARKVTAGPYEKMEDIAADDAKLAMLMADMRRRIASAEAVLDDVKRAVWKGRGQEDLATVALLADALATARSLADRLH